MDPSQQYYQPQPQPQQSQQAFYPQAPQDYDPQVQNFYVPAQGAPVEQQSAQASFSTQQAQVSYNVSPQVSVNPAHSEQAKSDEMLSIIILIIGLVMFWPILLVNLKFKNSPSPTARTLHIVSVVLLIFHCAMAVIYTCVLAVIVVIYVAIAVAGVAAATRARTGTASASVPSFSEYLQGMLGFNLLKQ